MSRSVSPPKMALTQLDKNTGIVYNNSIVSSDNVVLCFVVQLEIAVERPLFFYAKKSDKVVDLYPKRYIIIIVRYKKRGTQNDYRHIQRF